MFHATRTMMTLVVAAALATGWIWTAQAQYPPDSYLPQGEEPSVWTGLTRDFAAYDIDLSGGLSREEFARVGDPRLDGRSFDEFDQDGDGEVAPRELEGVLREGR